MAKTNPDYLHAALNSESEAQPYISALLASFSPRRAPVTRSQSSANGKRKRSPSPPTVPKNAFGRTPLTCLYVQGLDKDQIWAQLELRAQSVCKMLEYALKGTEEPTGNDITSTTDNLEQSSSEEEDSDLTYVESDNNSKTDEESRGSSDEELLEEGVTGLRDPPVDSKKEGLVNVPSSASPLGTKDDSGLDDGFFDLEEFNAETEEAEAGFVSNGALNADLDDIASDEDDVDYFTSIDSQLHDNDRGMSITPSVIVPSRNPDPVRTTLFRLL
jgi:U3 small nucleolar RNA-associated protein MPP10